MSPVLSTGVAIGVVTFLWTLVMGYTGWYKDPNMVPAFFLVILFEVILLYAGLRRTSHQTYGQQVVTGTLMSVVAAVLIFIGSYFFTTVLFPDYFEEIRAMQRQLLEAKGAPEAQIQQDLAASARMQTPVLNALTGVIGTIVTGVVASALIAIRVRRR